MLTCAPVWLDLRTQSTVERLISKTPGRNKNHLKVRQTGPEPPEGQTDRQTDATRTN